MTGGWVSVWLARGSRMEGLVDGVSCLGVGPESWIVVRLVGDGSCLGGSWALGCGWVGGWWVAGSSRAGACAGLFSAVSSGFGWGIVVILPQLLLEELETFYLGYKRRNQSEDLYSVAAVKSPTIHPEGNFKN